ncbi:MAG: hypothetical protein RLZZ618_4005 [Pseudomonadota bacterium]|jgi:predicted esterase YcpF (UPF0227 family)
MTTHLLYLHGFRSSPQSAKAQRTAAWVKKHAPRVTWWCPQLPPSPREAITQLLAGVAGWPTDRMAVIGSSLGGFYATVLAEQLDCPAVLLNPSVSPSVSLAKHIGETTNWHNDDRFFFQPGFVDELAELTPTELTRLSRYFAVIATGDEVLDWREMAERYRGAHLRIVEGSDHALSDYDDHLPHLLDFLDLSPSA